MTPNSHASGRCDVVSAVLCSPDLTASRTSRCKHIQFLESLRHSIPCDSCRILKKTHFHPFVCDQRLRRLHQRRRRKSRWPVVPSVKCTALACARNTPWMAQVGWPKRTPSSQTLSKLPEHGNSPGFLASHCFKGMFTQHSDFTLPLFQVLLKVNGCRMV